MEAMETPAESYARDEFSLTRWQPADAADLTATVNGSLGHIGAWMIWATDGYSAEDSVEFLQRTRKQWETGETHDFAIRVGGTIAVAVGLMAREGGAEIAQWPRWGPSH